MTRPYTQNDIERMIKVYEKNPTVETVLFLATKLRKTRMSVISKLSALGVYQRQVYRNKNGEVPRKKAEIVESLAYTVGIEPKNLVGLELAKKEALVAVDGAVKQFIFELQDEILDLTKELERAVISAEGIS